MGRQGWTAAPLFQNQGEIHIPESESTFSAPWYELCEEAERWDPTHPGPLLKLDNPNVTTKFNMMGNIYLHSF